MGLTPRGKALRWLTRHRGITEQPAGSNTDGRKDGIRAAQQRLGSWLVGLAWCGVWACNAALAGGVRIAKPYRWASVMNIEDDARAAVNGFRGWAANTPTGREKVLRSDLVILFGRGVHVETVRYFIKDRKTRRVLAVVTDGGNTSSGAGGSQSNGGGAFRRVRPISDVYGFALVDYPEA